MQLSNFETNVLSTMIKMRLVQTAINEHYKNKEFNIPIHLALGHEAIATALALVTKRKDKFILSHRNIHYNIARGASYKNLLNEYLLNKDGLASGMKGSMNLSNSKENILYTSSILGNNLGVSVGVALSLKLKKKEMTCVITGDGAIEEGSFYETLLFMSSHNLPALIIIENNGWSLGSRISERRTNIDVNSLAKNF